MSFCSVFWLYTLIWPNVLLCFSMFLLNRLAEKGYGQLLRSLREVAQGIFYDDFDALEIFVENWLVYRFTHCWNWCYQLLEQILQTVGTDITNCWNRYYPDIDSRFMAEPGSDVASRGSFCCKQRTGEQAGATSGVGFLMGGWRHGMCD